MRKHVSTQTAIKILATLLKKEASHGVKIQAILTEKDIRWGSLVFLVHTPWVSTKHLKKTEHTPKGFVSETYATILRSQGRYEEAIGVYKQLMLENPKKKRFFADQIDELQKK